VGTCEAVAGMTLRLAAPSSDRDLHHPKGAYLACCPSGSRCSFTYEGLSAFDESAVQLSSDLALNRNELVGVRPALPALAPSTTIATMIRLKARHTANPPKRGGKHLL
jgi:hypothetical protein